MRENYKQLVESIKEKYGVSKAYSYSQIKTFEDDQYEFYLHYIAGIEPDIKEQSLYSVVGTTAHDCLEAYFNRSMTKTECLNNFTRKFILETTDRKNRPFSSIGKINSSIISKYKADIEDYISRLDEPTGELFCEFPVTNYYEQDSCKAAFIGYIDFMEKNSDSVTIIDYKTARVYEGEDLILNSRQLLLYADAIRSEYNLEYSSIKAGWNFIRFARVINKSDMSEEIVERIKLNEYPEDQYLIKDCIVYIEVSKENVDLMVNNLMANVSLIELLSRLYEDEQDDTIFMYTVTEKDLFRLNNFCGYSEKYHKPLREYLNKSVDKL